MKTRYCKIGDFQNYKAMLKKKQIHFEVTTTNYTRKVVTRTETMMFNSSGEFDSQTLALINTARKDAAAYLEQPIEETDAYISWYSLIDDPKKFRKCYKIDIDGAYWAMALKLGVITHRTDDKLKKWSIGRSEKEIKMCRLRTLGSLATRKTVTKYVNGVADRANDVHLVQPTIRAYFDVAHGVDSLMRQCMSEVTGAFYYYWDCIFVEAGARNSTTAFFNRAGYGVSVDATEIVYIDMPRKGHIKTLDDGKIYPIKEEHKFMVGGGDLGNSL